MTDPMTAAELDAIEQRAHAATEGPWEAGTGDGDPRPHVWTSRSTGCVAHITYVVPNDYGDVRPDDAEFIAHARDDVPALLAEVRRLRAMEQRVSKVARELRYKNADTYDIVGRFLVALDGGE